MRIHKILALFFPIFCTFIAQSLIAQTRTLTLEETLRIADEQSIDIRQARAALQRHDIEAKCKAISRAVRIVDEGLKASLDVRAGGKLGEDLLALYGYVAVRLTQANLNNDAAALDECQSLLEPVRSAWAAIGPAVTTAVPAQ